MTDTLSGVLVGGARSSPLGGTDGDGARAVRRAGTALAIICDEIVATCGADRREAVADALDPVDERVRFATDPIDDGGPIQRLRTGLRFTRTPHALVVAGDRSEVDADLLAYLHERLKADGVDAVVPRVDDRLRPLCAAYDAAPVREACTFAIERDERRLTTLLSRLDVRTVEESTVETYADPASVERVERTESFGPARAETDD